MDHPLLDQMLKIDNQTNFLLCQGRKSKSVEFIWPTTESGAYFRATLHTREEFEKMKESNRALTKAFDQVSIFDTEVTTEQESLIKVFADNINEVFFKEPLIDIGKFKILNAHVYLGLFVKGDIYLADGDDVVIQLTSSNMFVFPAK